MFNTTRGSGIITVQYPCGGRGTAVDVDYHGPTWATWKLLDDLERHVFQGQKIKCVVCEKKLYHDTAEARIDFKAFVEGFTQSAKKAQDVLTKFSDALLAAVKEGFIPLNEALSGDLEDELA